MIDMGDDAEITDMSSVHLKQTYVREFTRKKEKRTA
jgi:hypothetical protein